MSGRSNERVTVNVTQLCDECGAVVKTPMTPEQAREHASAVLAAANNMKPVHFDPKEGHAGNHG